MKKGVRTRARSKKLKIEEVKISRRLDPAKLVSKKQIIVPEVGKSVPSYKRYKELKRRQMREFEASHRGSFRPPVDFLRPAADRYSVDAVDIKFIHTKFVLRKKRSPKPQNLKFLTKHCLSQFEKMITHFEDSEFGRFKLALEEHRQKSKARYPGRISGPSRQSQPIETLLRPEIKEFNTRKQIRILQHWKKRISRLNRPLVRKYWKLIFEEGSKFRSQNRKRVAFAQWPEDTTVKRGPSRRRKYIRGGEQREKLCQFASENRKALALVRMVSQRERLKFEKLKLDYPGIWFQSQIAREKSGAEGTQSGCHKNGGKYVFGNRSQSNLISVHSSVKMGDSEKKRDRLEKDLINSMTKRESSLELIEKEGTAESSSENKSTAQNTPDSEKPFSVTKNRPCNSVLNQLEISEILQFSGKEILKTRNLIQDVNQKVLGIWETTEKESRDIDLNTYCFNLMEQMFRMDLEFDQSRPENRFKDSLKIKSIKDQYLKDRIKHLRSVEQFDTRKWEDYKQNPGLWNLRFGNRRSGQETRGNQILDLRETSQNQSKQMSASKFRIKRSKHSTGIILRKGYKDEFLIEKMQLLRCEYSNMDESNLLDSPRFARKLDQMNQTSTNHKAMKSSQNSEQDLNIMDCKESVFEKDPDENASMSEESVPVDPQSSQSSSFNQEETNSNSESSYPRHANRNSEHNSLKKSARRISNYRNETPKKRFSSVKKPRRHKECSLDGDSYRKIFRLRRTPRLAKRELTARILKKRFHDLEDTLVLGNRLFSEIGFSPKQFGRRFLKRVKCDK